MQKTRTIIIEVYFIILCHVVRSDEQNVTWKSSCHNKIQFQLHVTSDPWEFKRSEVTCVDTPEKNSYKILFGHCSRYSSPGGSQETYEKMKNQNADLFVHLGDLHYGDLGEKVGTENRKNEIMRTLFGQPKLVSGLWSKWSENTKVHKELHKQGGTREARATLIVIPLFQPLYLLSFVYMC